MNRIEPIRVRATIVATISLLVAFGVVAVTDVQTEAILGATGAWLVLLGAGTESARAAVDSPDTVAGKVATARQVGYDEGRGAA